jgi:hypothetical protein
MWIIPLLLIIVMIGCDERTGLNSPPILTAPTVSSTVPAINLADVPFNQMITATFSQEMDSATITTASFTLMQGSSFVSGTVTYSGTTATFAPTSYLTPNTQYIATITTMAKNTLGIAMEANYVWSFTTGLTAALVPPTVSSTDPVNSSSGIPINQKIAATFSVPMNASTITASNFTLLQGTTPVPGFVSYSGITAIFAPSSNLAPNTAYSVMISTGVKDLAGNAMANNYIWSFTTGAGVIITPPTVSSIDPANNETGVALNQKVSATFSKTMDATTITSSTFTLKQGTTSVAGFVSYSGRTAIFAPSNNLTPNTVYTATITTGAKDLAGNAIENDFVWNFTTGAAIINTPPLVSSTDPANAETNVPFNQKVTATFSKTMDPSTITTASFTLMQGTNFVSGTVVYLGTTATYIPSSNLNPNTVYTATITTAAKDLMGNNLEANYVWSFTTGAGVIITPPVVSFTDPANLSTGVALNQKIAATFSKTMDASTINASTFVLMLGSTPVAGFVSYSNRTALFSPAINLLPNTIYTATITTGAKDLSGYALENNYVWTFTTGAAVIITPPTVNSTDPVNLATAVPLNQKVAATFSKTMDASTITTATFTLKQGTTPISGFVSYSGATATFAPVSNLAASTIYTATITTGAKDLAGNSLVSNYVWTFTTGTAVVIIPPTVSLTDPLHLATGVALNQKIAASFSKTMDASTLTGATFILKQGTTPVSGFVSYSGTTAIFAPADNLLPNTTYTATITTGAKDLSGTSMLANYVWSFTTGASVIITPPIVTSTDPANLATAIPLNQKVAATFSKTMDASTLTTATFTLKQGTTSISGFVSYTGTTATFAPANNLSPNTLYTATITTGAKDLSGNALAADYIWTFTTGSAVVIIPPTVVLTDPLNLAVDVPLDKTVTATFSKTMDASTITTATFTLMQGSDFVAGTVSYVGLTATYNPTNNLIANRLYTATITTGAKDLAGNSMVSNYVWSFTTSNSYSVALSSNPVLGGTTSGSGTYNNGTSVTVTALANAGYEFTNWTENGIQVSTNANYQFTISGNRTLVANFAVVQYTVALVSNPLLGGTTNGAGLYNSGSSVTVTAIANAGYNFTNWTENGIQVSTNANYQFTISGNRTLVANFAAVIYSVTLSVNPVVGGSVNGGGLYNSGSIATVIATGNAGYVFVNWTENGNSVSTSSSYQFEVTGNRILVANFIVGPGGLPINLGSAGDFAILGGSGVANTGFSIVNGDVGSFPTATINGFPPGVVVGTLYTSANPVVSAAKDALNTAYIEAQGRTLNAISLPGQLGGLTLAPGLYVNSTSSGISGTGANAILTLDAGGDPNAVWVFKMGSTLITDPGTSIVLAGGAKWENIFWSVGTSATFGTTSIFYGNILADQSITLNTGATLRGRALTRIAAVTLDASFVDKRP